jgi:hypothetical protein
MSSQSGAASTVLLSADTRQVTALRIRCQELELRCRWYLTRIRELEAYSASTFIRPAVDPSGSSERVEPLRTSALNNEGGAKALLLARELSSLRMALLEKQEVIDQLTVAANDRLRLNERAERERITLQRALQDMTLIAEQRGMLIAQLTSVADERQTHIDKLAAAADERLQVIKQLESIADERGALVDHLEAVAAERLKLIEELSATSEERLRRYATLEATANDQLQLIERLQARPAEPDAAEK